MPSSVNTGYVAYSNLEEYFLDNGQSTGNIVFNLPTNPNYVTPYYDPIQCPLPSPTPSITPTPSPSPSSSFEVYLHAKVNGILLSNQTASVYYKIDSGPWSPFSIGDVWNGWCTDLSLISVAPFSTLYLAMTTGSSQDILFWADENDTCSNLTYPNYCGKSTPYSIYIDDNKHVSLGARVNHTNQLALCNLLSPTPSVTPTVTPTVTPSGGPPFSDIITSRWLKGVLPLSCGTGLTITATGSGTTFCNSTQFYSTQFSTYTPGSRLALQYGGYALEALTDGTNFATVTSGCILCGSPSVTPTATPTPTPSVSTGTVPTITAVNTTMFNCAFPNDYVGYGLQLDVATSVNVYYILQLTMFNSSTNTFAYYAYVNGFIPAGSSADTANLNPCDGGGIYVGSNYYINNACIWSVDNTVNNPFGLCL